MDLTYMTKYSEEEIASAISNLKESKNFEIFLFMLIYGDTEEVIFGDNGQELLIAKKHIISRVDELISKYGEDQ